MPEKKNFIKKAIDNYKSKRRVKKLIKSGNQPEKTRADGTPVYKKGGHLNQYD
tara:strand:- start:641 stop:799 length:159 start_codon:yes stop_codon:yes gene_type:complete